MNTTFDAFLCSWPFDPWLLIALGLTAIVYLQGWLSLRRRGGNRWTHWHLTAFWGGLLSLFLALASPIEPFAALLLQVHMVQHLLLMMVAPPLLWLGEPLIPLLRGLPVPIRIYWVAPLFRSRSIRWLFQLLTQPWPALFLFIGATWFWHIPPIYEIALRSDRWHYLQHLCFLITGLLFWYPVVRPFPARPGWSSWLLFPYLILADIQNTILSALLAFSNRVLYPYYEQVPHLNRLTALDDQATAGVLMWVPGSIAYLLPMFVVGLRVLSGESSTRRALRSSPTRPVSYHFTDGRISLPLLTEAPPSSRSGFDALRIPVLGYFLKWRHARLALQIPLLIVAGLVILDGLSGPQAGALNLAGVLPWIHWRGFLIFGLLSAGNLFCLACPFMAPRTLARRWLSPRRAWPRWLRAKWPAVILLVLFLWSYEAFSLWDSPWWTAWIAIGYFVAAFVVDAFFRGASFCKYICPIGQFNFLQSLVSPLEVKVRDPIICTKCTTRDCIRGRADIPGCETGLFLPRKAGNMDCTFCLDCIHSCPHDNVGILTVRPAAELQHDFTRSGIGRFGKRPDLAAICLVLVFGAFANAAGMVAPVANWQERLSLFLGQQSSLLVTTLFYFIALLILPVLFVGTAAILSGWWGELQTSRLEVATRYAYTLIPLGFGMWLAHYSFHFLTSYDTIVPVMQRFAADHGWFTLGEPEWSCACCRPVSGWLLRFEILSLDIGLLLSLYTGYRLAITQASQPGQALKILTPWAVLIVMLFVAGIWIIFQPMQMRGTLSVGG